MSLFDTVKGMAGDQQSGDAGMMNHVMGMVNNPETGGLMGMVKQFRAHGLGGVVESWIGQGANQKIAAEAIEKVLGQDTINEIASKFGISPQDTSAKLAQLLPTVIDRLTPGGRIAA